MELVNNVDSVLGRSATQGPRGPQLTACYAMGSFPALWAVEGLGFHWTEMCHKRGERIDRVLSEHEPDALPRESLCMLHAGVGLSFAHISLAGLDNESSSRVLRDAMRRFLALCHEASRPGYRGCAIESLGIPTLILHGPKMARRLHDVLIELEPTAASFMWRGVGRALYFSPANFVAGGASSWTGLRIADRLAPDEDAWRNLHAGYTWALTLVNMLQPEIVEAALGEPGAASRDPASFVSGVVCSALMREDTTPGAPELPAFLARRARRHCGRRTLAPRYSRALPTCPRRGVPPTTRLAGPRRAVSLSVVL